MSKILTVVLFACVSGVVGGSIVAARPSHGATGVPPTAVAVIDMPKVMSGLRETKAAIDKLKANAAAANAQIDERKKTLSAKVDMLKQFKPGSPEYLQLSTECSDQLAYNKFLAEREQSKFDNGSAEVFRQEYVKIGQRASELAKEKGYEVLLNLNCDMKNFTAKDWEEFSKNNRTTVWLAPQHDLTDALIQLMNVEYQNRGVTPETPAPPASAVPAPLDSSTPK